MIQVYYGQARDPYCPCIEISAIVAVGERPLFVFDDWMTWDAVIAWQMIAWRCVREVATQSEPPHGLVELVLEIAS